MCMLVEKDTTILTDNSLRYSVHIHLRFKRRTVTVCWPGLSISSMNQSVQDLSLTHWYCISHSNRWSLICYSNKILLFYFYRRDVAGRPVLIFIQLGVHGGHGVLLAGVTQYACHHPVKHRVHTHDLRRLSYIRSCTPQALFCQFSFFHPFPSVSSEPELFISPSMIYMSTVSDRQTDLAPGTVQYS